MDNQANAFTNPGVIKTGSLNAASTNKNIAVNAQPGSYRTADFTVNMNGADK
jgi:hypothetical protein